MKAIPCSLPGVLILEPRILGDSRGHFFESWNARTFRDVTGLDVQFVQDNESRSQRGVLRGLHYQIEQAQGKMVRVGRGRVFDVCLDIRRSSPTFGKWLGLELSDENFRQLWIPAGFAHGYLVMSETADFLYKTTEYYAPQHERTILWNDPAIAVEWPLDPGQAPILSAKDAAGVPFADSPMFR
jgi:dTDP-4-dehydrorhamnose 3,5-epimerase